MLKASVVQVTLTSDDMMSMIVDHIPPQIDQVGLTLEPGIVKIRFRAHMDGVPVYLPLEFGLQVLSAAETVVVLSVTWRNMPLIPGAIKERVLRLAFSKAPGAYIDGVYTLELAELMPGLPASFSIAAIDIAADGIVVSLTDLLVSEESDRDVTEIPIEALSLAPEPSYQRPAETVPEHGFYYTRLRERMAAYAKDKAPGWVQPMVPWILAAPDFFVLLVRLLRDDRLPGGAKVIAGLSVAYFLSPSDLVPDILPMLGIMDDVALGLYAIDQISSRIPAELVQEHWPGDGEVIEIVRSGSGVFTKALPAQLLALVRRQLKKV